TTEAEALAEERKHDLPIAAGSQQRTRGSRGGGGPFSGSPVSARWLDGAHWLQVREGKLFKVDAVTGRSRPFVDPIALAKGLKRLPTIDDETAQSIARGMSFDMDPTHKGFLFEHDDDLYYATLDGSTAV